MDEKGKKNKLSAPQYADYVMTYVQKVVNDESSFPTKHGKEFPAQFDQVSGLQLDMCFEVERFRCLRRFRNYCSMSLLTFTIHISER